MTIDIAPETERIVREELRRGHFRSVDDLILSGVEAWREREKGAERTLHAQGGASSDTVERPIWEVISEIMKDVPAEDLSTLPKDGASQIDHYIYGLPKRDE